MAGIGHATARRLKYRARTFARNHGVELVKVSDDATLHSLHLARLFKQYDIRTVLDVGARVGDFGTWLRDGGYRGRILSFEPVAESFAELQARAAADREWEAFPYALGSVAEHKKINVTNYTVFSSFRTPTEAAVAASQGQIGVQSLAEVEVRRLDDVWAEVVGSRPGGTYLKLDTQGWDLEVLAGASGVLHNVAALQTEASNRPTYEGMPDMIDALQAVRRLGFTVSGMFPINAGAELAPVEFDCVGVRLARDPLQALAG